MYSITKEVNIGHSIGCINKEGSIEISMQEKHRCFEKLWCMPILKYDA